MDASDVALFGAWDENKSTLVRIGTDVRRETDSRASLLAGKHRFHTCEIAENIIFKTSNNYYCIFGSCTAC